MTPNPLLPDNWQELAPLVDAILDAPPERRAAVLAEVSAGDPERRAVLERLVADCDVDQSFLNRPAAERFAHLVSESADVALTGTLGDRYRIERELGRGGMARVYLGYDLKHCRDVAVKVIRPEVAASMGRERFLREIAIAARLRHPNIVPLYDSGDADGVLYFVMPYEEGQSLRQRLSEGLLTIAESLSVLRDVARALAYAHEHGVVHRDVKPDNVMLSGGATLVTDFGIAKALSVAQGEASSTLTQMGAGIGTPAYMSPEQAVGDPSTDHRTDIYAFGCLAYELFTGKPPFCDMATHQIIGAHVATVPAPVTDARGDVPAPVAELIARCLEKNPAMRPARAKELLTALDGVTTTGSNAPLVKGTRRKGRVLWSAGLFAAAVVATAAYVVGRDSRSSPPITLAVLPFANIGADTAVDFVAGGLAEQVALALARVQGIQVKSLIGARAYRGQLVVDLGEAGSRLKADYLVTGSLRQDRGRWILSADLSRAADATVLWGESFTMTEDRQAGAAETIAGSLIGALRSRFPRSISSGQVVATNQRTSNPEAYRLYLRGQVKLDRRGQSVRESADLFRAAIREDSMFAKAYSGLSLALGFFPYFQGVAPSEVRAELIRTAERAIALDSTLAQPHVALGMAHIFEYKWDLAAAEYQRAIRLDDRNIEARVQYGRYFRFRGRVAQSMAQFQAARAIDPSSALVLSHVSYAYFLERQLDSALAESRRALDNDSTNLSSLGLGAVVRLANNLPEEALKLALASPKFGTTEYVIAKSGDTATVRRRLRDPDAIGIRPWESEARRALAYLGLGDTAAALSALERDTDAGQSWAAGVSAYEPVYDSIRESARFKALLRRVGLEPERR